ncbi:MAG TPA: dihydrolipoamide acetyltransferase family protein [Nitrospiria bacterium]|nr:dihydrolipoamide acetyltransferase family protein [Nitrospiria bacterium]
MPKDVIMPQMGESIVEGTILNWLIKEGDVVLRDQPIVEISTDKVDTEIPSPAAGTIKKILHAKGETVKIGTPIAIIEEVAEAGATVTTAPRPAVEKSLPATPIVEEKERYSPLVRRLAEEHRINLEEVAGTGEGGRVTKKDMLDFIEKRKMKAAPSASKAETIPLSIMRKTIAERMVASKRTSPHVTTVFEADMSNPVLFRERVKDLFLKKEGVGLTYLPIIIKAVTQAILEFPILNSSLVGDDIIIKGDINIGIAVAIEDGLIVPVIKGTDKKDLATIARETHDLAERARGKKLIPEDVQGGTFTITNHGVFGSLFSTPIISQPQIAILGVGTIEKRPVVINDAIAIRSMVYLSLSFDHRAIDGAIADQFMKRIKIYLETGDSSLWYQARKD